MEFKALDPPKIDTNEDSAIVEVWMKGEDLQDLLQGLNWFLEKVKNMDDDVAELYQTN